jgi:hypothetical protein
MFSEVCIPLATPCLFTPLLYPEGFLIVQDYINRVCDVAADGLLEAVAERACICRGAVQNYNATVMINDQQ